MTIPTLRYPFYLWILSLYPVLHLYLRNHSIVVHSEALLTIIAVLAGTSLAFVLTKNALPNIHSRALILTVWSLVHSLSGHIYIEYIMPFSLTVWSLALISILVILTFLARRYQPKRGLARLTPTINIVASVMLAMQLAQLGVDFVENLREDSIFDAYISAHAQAPSAAKVLDSPESPDIYYIIPDAYPSDSWHMQAMNHDNSAFTQALQALGFQVAAEAQSNYSATKLSLPSTLNLRYFDDNPTSYEDSDYLRFMSDNNLVAREMLQQGYTYIHWVSGSFGTSPLADINKTFTDLEFNDLLHADFPSSLDSLLDTKESFFTLYVDTSLLRTVGSQLAKLAQLLTATEAGQPGLHESENFLQSLSELEKIAQMPQATFTIAHLQKPHWPVTFNAKGETIGRIRYAKPQQYFDELSFINQRLLATLTKLVQAAPQETIIIFQADHGSTYGYFHYAQAKNTYFPIYAAYYVPRSFDFVLPQSFTSVNSFALLLNNLFDRDYELQEDRFFTLQDWYDTPFEQVEVTEEWLARA